MSIQQIKEMHNRVLDKSLKKASKYDTKLLTTMKVLRTTSSALQQQLLKLDRRLHDLIQEREQLSQLQDDLNSRKL